MSPAAYMKNFYDSFAVKTVHKNDETVGYLPR